MILTEDEAKTKQCRAGGMTPVAFETAVGLAQSGAPSMLGGARFGPIQWPTCAASGCMHWRWERGEPSAPSRVTHGYCGLAGG